MNNNKQIKQFNINEFNHYFWDFNPIIYKSKYTDLNNLNKLQLKKHYYYIGRFQRRIYNNAIKILIVCDPWNDDNVSFATGGNKALYNLGKLINEKKQYNIYAKMYVYTRKNVLNPFCNFFAYDNEINPNTLVIYPDGNEGNPLNAKNVMRWILLEVGTTYKPLSITKTWGLNDLVYHWQPSNISKNTKILNVTSINNIYINKNYNRVIGKTCYLIKKRILYNFDNVLIHPSNSICIDKLLQIDIVNLFNTCEIFYCYDFKSFLLICAIICGCKVIVVPNNMTKNKYIEESCLNNCKNFNKLFAWGNNDLCNIDNNSKYIEEMIVYLNSLSNSADIFLEDIYKYFNSKNLNINIPTVKTVYK